MVGRKENLVPIKTTERARELGRKGGLANKNNPRTKISARLRVLKQKGLTDENAKHLLDMLDDPEYASLDHLLVLDKLKAIAKTPYEISILSNALNQWYKTHHGSKDSARVQINTQINTNLSEEEKKQLVNRLIKKE